MTHHTFSMTESPFSDFGFPQKLEFFKTRLAATQTASESWEVFRDFAASQGFDHVVFAHEATDDGADRIHRFKWSSVTPRQKVAANVRPPFDPVKLLKSDLKTPSYFGASFF
ncbi:MAG: hypothetical protein MK160_01375, partial [Rhodobacteraceae bacterium]|nr:hypothetical protein [Paracoccaceae bacterium]